MDPYSAPPGEAWRLGPGPFIFSGVPPLCVGDIDLINESDDKVRVRRIPVISRSDLALPTGLRELRVAGLLPPAHRTRARAFFRIDSSTRPGTYRAELSCGDQQEPVIVHVWERRTVRIDPGELRLRGAAGERLTTVVVVANEGNVTENVRDLALVFLEERNWVGRSAVFALRETKADEGHHAYLDRVLGELKDSLVRPVRVDLRCETAELHPGDIREVELEMTLPGELMKGRTYFGSTRFMSGKLVFTVDCLGSNHGTSGRVQ